MMERLTDTLVVLVAFIAALGCYTALAIVGADGARTLEVIVSSLGGAVAGVAVSHKLKS